MAAGDEGGGPAACVSHVFPGGVMCGNLKARFGTFKIIKVFLSDRKWHFSFWDTRQWFLGAGGGDGQGVLWLCRCPCPVTQEWKLQGGVG